MAKTRIVLLQRVRSNEGDTLHFISEGLAGAGRSRVGFVNKEHVPDFTGTYAWFEVERVPATPWPYWKALRQVAPPEGWKPPEPVKRTPAQLLGHR